MLQIYENYNTCARCFWFFNMKYLEIIKYFTGESIAYNVMGNRIRVLAPLSLLLSLYSLSPTIPFSFISLRQASVSLKIKSLIF